jgi:N-acetylglutamate synthase-like GNAT family acetyltransferase
MHNKDGSMNNVNIREATIEDIVDLQSFSKLFDPGDYLIRAWADWLKERDDINLLAEMDTRIIGCLHAEMLTSIDGWAQGLRVHPDYKNEGIGKELLKASQAALKSRGVTHVRSTIDAFNKASQIIVHRLGWVKVDRICRRRRKGAKKKRAEVHTASLAVAHELIGTWPTLASRPHLSYVHRSYFRMMDAFLSEIVEKKQFVYTPDFTAYAFHELDSGAFPNSIWITSLRGESEGMKKILEALLSLAAELGIELVADSPDESSIQKQMDALGFDPAPQLGRYIVVENQLEGTVME